ncbi:MAG: ABC transporter permease [Dehalococcoidia bacterium]
MKSSLYTSYSTRSLVRGGQRTILALFCIAVGVMAIVGLQLASKSMLNAFTGDARALNQGDVSLMAPLQATLSQNDLAAFDRLKSQGQITAYSPQYTNNRSLVDLGDGRYRFMVVRAVDSATFPLVGGPRVAQPSGTSLKSLLDKPNGALASKSLQRALHIALGSSFTIRSQGSANPARLTLVGVLENDNATAQGDSVLTSTSSWQQATGVPLAYTFVGVTTKTPSGATATALALRQQFPLATVQTSDDLLKQAKSQVETIRKFLIVVGLLALLIGGVGIVNTMQVLLSRRRTEIAILKTTGYRRRDLYLLFGMEAGLLGLMGGILGAILGILVSLALRGLFERATNAVLPIVLDPVAIIGGILVGLATSLIFGLLPIAKAAAARPQAILRDMPEGRSKAAWLSTAALLLLLSALFFVLASIILQSLLWGAAAVYGGLAFLLLLSLALGGVLWVIGHLPIPEHYSLPYLLLVTVGLLVALGITAVPPLRGIGILIVLFTLLGYVIVLVPRPWKVSTKLALRNIGRTRGRTTTTLLALFIGVFTVGVVLVLGQDLRTILTDSFSASSQYNLASSIPLADAPRMDSEIGKLSGVEASRWSDVGAADPISINGQPVAQRLPQGQNGPTAAAQQALTLIQGVQGYNVSTGDLPKVAQITAGRNLSAADAGTNNVIVDSSLHGAPLRLNPGDTLTLHDPQAGKDATMTVIGFYKLSNSGFGINLNAEAIFGTQDLALSLAGNKPQRSYYFRVPTNKVSDVQNQLQQAIPGIFVFNFGNVATLISGFLDNFIVVFTAIGALALVASVVIVANAVALAMLEQRRELGVLKALGYTSQRILSGVLIENGIAAGLGGLLGMVLVALVVAIFGRLIKTDLSVGAPISLLIVVGVIALATITASLVAWRAVRVRPLEVLRYE